MIYHFYHNQVRSLPGLVTDSISQSVTFCPLWILFKLDLSKLLDGFVKIYECITLPRKKFHDHRSRQISTLRWGQWWKWCFDFDNSFVTCNMKVPANKLLINIFNFYYFATSPQNKKWNKTVTCFELVLVSLYFQEKHFFVQKIGMIAMNVNSLTQKNFKAAALEKWVRMLKRPKDHWTNLRQRTTRERTLPRIPRPPVKAVATPPTQKFKLWRI